MATTADEFVPVRRWRRPIVRTVTAEPEAINRTIVSDRAFLVLVTVMLMFAYRDMLTSSLRYYLSLVHLGVLWFVPDILSFGIMGYFTWNIALKHRSPFAILLVLSFTFSMTVGIIFMQTNLFSMFSAAKLFMPFFVGASMVGRSVTELRWVTRALIALFVISTVGVLLEPHISYPWLGQALDNFGQVKKVGRIWWAGGGKIRYGGFAGESTMASYMMLIPYAIVHFRFSRLVNALLWIPIYYAITLTTNKTALIVFFFFIIWYLYTHFLSADPTRLLRRIAALSFLTIPIVFIAMVVLSGVDLTSVDPVLFSLQDRIQHTWGFPFIWMSENYPAGLFIGCGMGCFTYPMQYTKLASLWVPVDNFYLSTLAMMGLPFAVFVIGMFTAVYKSASRQKLLLIAMVNFYSVTVQGYGPSTCAILLAYAFSDMFLPSGRNWMRKFARQPSAS